MIKKSKAIKLAERYWHLDEECEIHDGFDFGVKCAVTTANEVITELESSGHINSKRLKYWYNVLGELKQLLEK